MDHSRNLLYIAPVIPARTGNGLAMRTGAVLRALAKLWRVYLLVVPHYPSPVPMSASEIDALCVQTAIVPMEGDAGSDAWVERASRAFEPSQFDVVHHVRLATLRFGVPYLSAHRPARAHVDLDDVESVARRRLADIFRRHGREPEAQREEAEAARAEKLERVAMQDFERVYVCSTLDRARLLPDAKAELRVLPNVIDLPPAAHLARPTQWGEGWLMTPARPFSLLFAGTLGYFPNEDAVLYFCREILPLLRDASPRPVQLDIAGTGPTAELIAGTAGPGVRVLGPVPDLAPCYEQADAVVVPLRAGGGTRIKVLEAFAHSRPVVSTSLGLEGIEARDGEHLLIADQPAAFAAACMRLMRDPALVQRLTTNAYDLVRRRYNVKSLERALA